jgi:hypothetical protein
MMNLGDFGPDVSPEPKLAMLIHWKKVAEALFSDITRVDRQQKV